ncbi:uncharacterized protein PHACADRAFT_202566 [Phanerochaete carnosa HHB-10118-sp]|uniref:Uncharacterized protein n=1 Tax=Phanerochaete carnosa (strain HHB-10118-sp) TaxID=650164 RepID=K5VPJ6_PHACS|nr:uncharacterized protein PHACADRAFT_202566 [Phanerochaete carnosa HHB-10118-sp]EKM48645.1 hypothetical protein PHACADRAFT_202566 [Phanerochaete carnosa HHB-10118-sp]
MPQKSLFLRSPTPILYADGGAKAIELGIVDVLSMFSEATNESLCFSARVTSSTSPATASTLAELHDLDRSIAWLDHWLKVTTALASDAPPDPELRGVVRRKLIAMSDVHAQKESERYRVRAEPFGAASGDDGYATESDVEEDDQSGDKESGYGGDDDSDDAQNQLLPVRRRPSTANITS